jgi:hypothetical protein
MRLTIIHATSSRNLAKIECPILTSLLSIGDKDAGAPPGLCSSSSNRSPTYPFFPVKSESDGIICIYAGAYGLARIR